MKKFIPALSIATYLSLVPAAFAQATINTCPVGSFAFLCDASFSGVVGTLITTIFILAIIVALFYLIWGGFKWLTSGGDKTHVQEAREHIIAAIIGLVIVFLSYFILNIILGFFHLSLGTFTLPALP